MLLVLPTPVDGVAIERALAFATGRRWQTVTVDSVAGALSALEALWFDAVLVDELISEAGAEALLRQVGERGDLAPVIVLTDRPDEATAQSNLRLGAEDYLSRDELDGQRLVKVVTRACARHQRRADLTMQNRVLEDLVRERTREVAEIQDLERQRLAEALHDESGQWMTALNAQLGALEMRCEQAGNPDLRAQVEACRRMCEGAMTEISRVCRHLHPSVIEHGGLVPALRSWQSGDASPRVTVQINDMDEARLSPEVQLAVYRCAQESLTNARKHATASTVHITLARRRDHVELAVLDDGVGIRDAHDTSGIPMGVGLVGMRQRIEQLSGQLQIEPNFPHGTAVRVSVPLMN